MGKSTAKIKEIREKLNRATDRAKTILAATVITASGMTGGAQAQTQVQSDEAKKIDTIENITPTLSNDTLQITDIETDFSSRAEEIQEKIASLREKINNDSITTAADQQQVIENVAEETSNEIEETILYENDNCKISYKNDKTLNEQSFLIVDKVETDALGNNEVSIDLNTAVSDNKAHQEYQHQLAILAKKGISLRMGTAKDFSGPESDAAAYTAYGTPSPEIVINPQRKKKEDLRNIWNMQDGPEFELAYKSFAATEFEAYRIHEEQHGKYLLEGLKEDDIHPEYQMKREMLEEVGCNLATAGYALSFYKATGRTEAFDHMRGNLGNEAVENIKKYVTSATNQDKLDTDSFKYELCQMIENSWLKKNNIANSSYSNEIAMNNSSYRPLSGMRSVSKKVFDERIDKMFSEIPFLGDMRPAISSDIKLNPDLQELADYTNFPSNAEKALETLSHNQDGSPAQSICEMSNNIMQNLNKLKENADNTQSKQTDMQQDQSKTISFLDLYNARTGKTQ